DLQRFFIGGNCLAWISPRTAISVDRVPECASAEAQFNSTVSYDVQCRRGFCEHGRWSHRKIAHVGEEADLLGRHCKGADQSPSVEEGSIVGMVLDADNVESRLVGCTS